LLAPAMVFFACACADLSLLCAASLT